MYGDNYFLPLFSRLDNLCLSVDYDIHELTGVLFVKDYFILFKVLNDNFLAYLMQFTRGQCRKKADLFQGFYSGVYFHFTPYLMRSATLHYGFYRVPTDLGNFYNTASVL